ncbi:hypothetical protein [Companilactobacillus sp. DQM5]|uniref:hypothetical protein n=1 Tax=Companilactobacillus sp. DQM5 TaxID=3463359 RepID=UPI0040580703
MPVIFFWIIIYLLILWGSQVVYNQSLVVTLKNSYVYFMFLLYFYLAIFLKKRADFNFILNSIKLIGLFYSLLLLLQSVLISQNIFFLDLGQYGLNPIYDSFGPIFHFVRIAGPADFISFSILVTIIYSNYNERNHFILDLIIIGIDLMYIIFVSGTRMYMIIDIVLFLVFIGYMAKKRTPLMIYLGAVFGGIGSIAIFPLLINMFTSGSRKESLNIRINEFMYYLGKIFNNNWFGIGFPDSKRFGQLIHGPISGHIALANAKYFLEDMGVLEIPVIFGIFGIIGILFFMHKVFYFFINSTKKIIALNIVIYLILMAPTLSLIDSQRIFYLFVIIYIMEYLLGNKAEKNNESNKLYTYN